MCATTPGRGFARSATMALGGSDVPARCGRAIAGRVRTNVLWLSEKIRASS